MPSADVAQLGDDVVELGEQRRPAGRRRRRTAPDPATVDSAAASGIARAAVVGERRVRGGAGLAVRRRRRPARPRAPPAASSSSGSSSAGGVELGDLEPQQVDLAGPCRAVAAERGQLGVELGEAGPRRAQRCRGRRRRSASSAARWVGPASRLWWACWPCRSTSPAAALGERADGRRPPVDVGPRAAVGGHHAGQHELVVADDEAAVDAGLVGAGAHDRGVGAPADEQLERLDEHRLAGARSRR